MFPNLKELVQMTSTFLFVVIGWIFFRSGSINAAIHFFEGMIQWGTFRASYRILVYKEFWFIIILILVEWHQRFQKHGLELSLIYQAWIRRTIYCLIIIMIIWFMGKNETFIYFQF